MRRGLAGLLVGVTLAIAVSHGHNSPASAETRSRPATTTRSHGQLKFQLPPDWPIEERGGLVGPIPVEEYLAMKFSALDARLQGLEQQLSGLDLRIRVLEEAQKKQQTSSGLRSSELQ